MANPQTYCWICFFQTVICWMTAYRSNSGRARGLSHFPSFIKDQFLGKEIKQGKFSMRFGTDFRDFSNVDSTFQSCLAADWVWEMRMKDRQEASIQRVKELVFVPPPILQRRKLKLREMKRLIHSHMINKCLSQGLLLDPSVLCISHGGRLVRN